jgi:predicted transcriptional regulator
MFFESVCSDLRVFDAPSNLIGVLDENFVNEIPDAQIIVRLGLTRAYFIPNNLDLTCEITGIENGSYEIGFLNPQDDYLKISHFSSYLNQSEIDTFHLKKDLLSFTLNTYRQKMNYSLTLENKSAISEKKFNLFDMELAFEEIHEYEVLNWGAIEDEKGAVILNIDEDGDGEFEFEVVLENGWAGSDIQNAIFVKPGKSPVVMPFEMILLLGFVISLSVMSAAFLLTEVGKVAFFYYIYVLYTRIKKEYLLDNFTRGEIFGYIKANPGVHFSEIKRALELKNGSLAYHIRALEKRDFIVSKRDRGYKRFYPKTMKLPARNIRELIPMQRNIMEIVKESPGISQTNIAEQLDISFQLVHYHVKILLDADYMILEKDGKQTYCYDKETYKKTKENT